MKYLLGIILSLTAGSAFAGAIPFPECVVNNQPVTYRSVHSTYHNSYVVNGTAYVAGSDIINGRPIISYNSTLLSTKPKEWNLQVMLHECVHLKLHAHKNPNPSTKEYEADCHSATVLKNKYGYKDEEFDIILDTMRTVLPKRRIVAFRSCLAR